MDNKIRAIITGVTGMVGEGVLMECLKHPQVEAVLVINRKPCGFVHPKLKEIIHGDFFDLSAIEGQLSGYNACYFCLGVSSVGMKEPEYTKLTYDLTMNFARTVSRLNTDMTFTYVSGAQTDSTEKGKSMWARVKGKTENDLMKLPFKQAFAFRPGLMKAAPDAKNTPKLYRYLSWLYPFLHTVFPNSSCLLSEVGQAMINVTLHGFEKNILEVRDIVAAAKL
ncbi:MAG: NAD-dependent epimerase/dehydratase family protein [Mucilaginibacter sp.]|uniref:NAD-dependent epimerase/dehydratase family protein n=1 Tax=Mucilaginibacter sp. TaxID=1882438 RepID=UPI003263CE91